MGVNRFAYVHGNRNDRCPHARGGEPTEEMAENLDFEVVPTHVGVNLITAILHSIPFLVVPTHVGVNLEHEVPAQLVGTSALSPRTWG